MTTAAVDEHGLHVDNPHTLRTTSGRIVDPFNLTADDVSLDDIARALAYTCRFGGHVSRFLSVAEHSVNVANSVWTSTDDPTLALAGLLHDAHEYLTGDIPKPIKTHPHFDHLAAWEDRIDTAIGEAFDIDPALFHHPVVKAADRDDYFATCDRRVGKMTAYQAEGEFTMLARRLGRMR